MNCSKSLGGVRRSSEIELSSSGSSKRRKFDYLDHENVAELDNQCRSEINVNSSVNFVSSPESTSNCDNIVSCSCLQNDLSLDLKVELRLETETTISINDDRFSREETSASSEICLDSNEMESTSALTKKPAPAALSSFYPEPIKASSIPSAAEIDEFFAQAEKNEQKRFADKYNYDIVKDVPMEGRYQWIRLKQ